MIAPEGAILGTANSSVLPSSDLVIDAYRWAVLATHAAVFLYFVDTNILAILTKDVEPLCWPYFQTCSQIRFATITPIKIMMVLYFCLILATALALAAKRYQVYWALMLALNGYLFALVSLDYRFRGSEFYELFWLNAVFLFWPTKRWAIPLILVSFYFWAGILKLNYEWLSGSVLYHPLYIIPMRLAWVACAYVVILEITLIWGLLAKAARIRWLALSQVVLFHVESLSQIHWFYALLMAAMLSWFVIEWTASKDQPIVSLANVWRGRAPRSAYVLLAMFAGFQIAPYFFHGDKTLEGQGGILALHMFEARQVCDVHALAHHRDHSSDDIDLLLPELAPRLVCDPIVYFDRMTNLCRSNATDPNFADADFVMHARRTTDATMTTIADEVNFCSRHETYRIFSNNSWMK
jgi:hypothetical protein